MANTLSFHQILAAESAAILEESCPFLMGVNRSREKDFQTNVNSGGFKVGNTVSINVPGVSPVYSGATLAEGGAVADFEEKTVPLTISTHLHTALSVTVNDAVFKLDATDPRRKDYRERVLKPQLASLSAAIEADLLARAVAATANIVGTPGTLPTTMKTFNQARAKMNKALAPFTDRRVIYSSEANIELIDSSKQLFNPQAEIAKQYKESYIGRASQADWFEAVNLPRMLNGNDVAATVSGAGQTGSNLLVSGVAAGSTFIKGQIFTIAGVKSTHPLTGVAFSEDMQFVITADTTATGTTVSLPIYPPIAAVMPNKTVNATPADLAALTFFGAASTGYVNDLMFQRDAFTAAFVPVPVVAGADGYQLSDNGIRLTVQTGGSITNLSSVTRLDVMYGFAAVRPRWASRITE
jgi:hypothetical protein